MNVYMVSDGREDEVKFFGTRSEAHAHAKTLNWFNVIVELRDVPLDKKNVLMLMNIAEKQEAAWDEYEFKRRRRWVMSARGGLKDDPDYFYDTLNDEYKARV